MALRFRVFYNLETLKWDKNIIYFLIRVDLIGIDSQSNSSSTAFVLHINDQHDASCLFSMKFLKLGVTLFESSNK